MSVYGIGTGYFAWQVTEKIQKNNSGTDFADMIANKETKKEGHSHEHPSFRKFFLIT